MLSGTGEREGDPDQATSRGGTMQPRGRVQLGEVALLLSAVVLKAGAGTVLDCIPATARVAALTEGVIKAWGNCLLSWT